MTQEQLWIREAVEGRWFGRLRRAANAFMAELAADVTGDVTFELAPQRLRFVSLRAAGGRYLRSRAEGHEPRGDIEQSRSSSTLTAGPIAAVAAGHRVGGPASRPPTSYASCGFKSRALEERFGGKLHVSPRIFIAHGAHGAQAEQRIRDALERLHGRLAKPLVALLAGIDHGLLAQLGDPEFRDPVTNEQV